MPASPKRQQGRVRLALAWRFGLAGHVIVEDCCMSAIATLKSKLDWPALAVLGVAVVLAAITYQQFLAVDRHLWDNSTHDRNAHYLYALHLATDAQHLRVLPFLDDVNQARVWPPLQGLVTAGVLLVGGLDYRLAVLPSLAGWVGTVFL